MLGIAHWWLTAKLCYSDGETKEVTDVAIRQE
jgi:hypothetical protein